MRFSIFLFAFSVMATGRFSLAFEDVDVFEKSIEDYQTKIGALSYSISTVIRETTYSTMSLFNDLNDHLESLSKSLMKEECRNKFYLDNFSDKLKVQIHLSKLEEPLLKNMAEMKHRLKWIVSSIGVYRAVADTMLQSCLIFTYDDSDCQVKAASWLKEKMTSLQCQLVSDCSQHAVHKRQVMWCSPGRFQCSDGSCILEEDVCRGVLKCPNESEMPENCERFCFNGFHCKNRMCIKKQQICDNFDDCGDNSDEEDCAYKIAPFSPSNCSLDSGNFLCTNGQCIPVSGLCNNQVDCVDGSDEEGLCGSSCPAECGDQGGVCFSNPKGPLCLSLCPQGYVEVSGGCQRFPGGLLPSTVEQLVNDVPRMLTRYHLSVSLLQQAIEQSLSKPLQEVSMCLGQPFSSLEKIIHLTMEKKKAYSITSTSSMP